MRGILVTRSSLEDLPAIPLGSALRYASERRWRPGRREDDVVVIPRLTSSFDLCGVPLISSPGIWLAKTPFDSHRFCSRISTMSLNASPSTDTANTVATMSTAAGQSCHQKPSKRLLIPELRMSPQFVAGGGTPSPR